MNRYLIVIDMQNDFVTGALGTKEAQEIVPALREKIDRFDGPVWFTRDTHEENYLQTQEGKMLPVEHCIKGSDGWAIIPELRVYQQEHNCPVFDKGQFGSTELAEKLKKDYEAGKVAGVELAGVCTDICVVSNALLIKAYISELPVVVDALCCAGVTPEKHQAALETMRSCQVIVHESCGLFRMESKDER